MIKIGVENIWEEIAVQTARQKVLAVVSERVNKLYNPQFEHKFVLKDGEDQKNFKNWEKILDAALKAGLSRKDAIVAVGGGVTGDIAGFAAATYMRGIDIIQVPTTLLACVDSSVGGKTAVNTRHGKNLAGAFHQPKAVLTDVKFLQTLDQRQFKTGLAEVVKYAFIEKTCGAGVNDWGIENKYGSLANFLSKNIDKILRREPETMTQLIGICVNIKAAVVQRDEKESGLRRVLNFGHTYGHAIEKETRYKKFTHGECVAEGMRFAFKLALERGLIDEEYARFAFDLMAEFNFREIPKFPPQRMFKHMQGDKKASGGQITFVLPVGYGEVAAVEY
jgi:3-dehydroquinate synthase